MNALTRLIEGHARFRKECFAVKKILMSTLATQQQPKTMVIACSDSRVDPAILFDCDPGDIFVVRNVANLVPAADSQERNSVGAALEYAICYLNVEHVIILGHSSCGGIAALTDPSSLHQDHCISSWVKSTTFDPASHQTTQVNELAQLSLHQSYKNCLTYSWLNQRVNSGALTLHRWFYDFGTGEIHAYDQNLDGFRDIVT